MSEPVVFRSTAEMRSWSRTRKALGESIGFVPTMGALHDGHASLLRLARERTRTVVLSIFVNPTQFGPGEDFERYPRTWDSDLAIAGREGVAAVFAPGPDFYPKDYRTLVTVPGWKDTWEGAIRPGHFDGVASVVAKLFHAVECDLAVFGQKDAQQALVLRRMVEDLDFPVKMVIAPILREADGLAMSSRNRYLSPAERMRSLVLSRALLATALQWEAGERSPEVLLSHGRKILATEPPDSIDYFSLLDPRTLECLDSTERLKGPALLMAAARYGTTRLLDNTALGEVWD